MAEVNDKAITQDDIFSALEGERFTWEDLLHIFDLPKTPWPNERRSAFYDELFRLVGLNFVDMETTYTLSSDGRKLLDAAREEGRHE